MSIVHKWFLVKTLHWSISQWQSKAVYVAVFVVSLWLHITVLLIVYSVLVHISLWCCVVRCPLVSFWSSVFFAFDSSTNMDGCPPHHTRILLHSLRVIFIFPISFFNIFFHFKDCYETDRSTGLAQCVTDPVPFRRISFVWSQWSLTPKFVA